MSTSLNHSVILSPIDHIMPSAYVSYLLYFWSEDPTRSFSLLEAGVRNAKKALPILLGNVVVNPELDGKYNVQSVEISCSQEDDILLVHKGYPSSMEVELEDVRNCVPMHVAADSKQHLCPLPPLIPLTETQPVVRFQANVFTDGLVLAMAFHHGVFDGTGAAKILELLGRCCRDPSTTPLPLVSELEDRAGGTIFGVPEDKYPLQDHTGEIAPVTAILHEPHDAASLRTYRFKFSRERISHLKNQCTQLLKRACLLQPDLASISAVDLPPFLTSNDILTSALADAIQRARSHDKKSRTYDCLELFMAVNMRDRIQLPIAREFMGNMVSFIRLKSTGPEDRSSKQCLCCRPTQDSPISNSQLRFITELACKVRAKIRKIDRQHFHSLMTYLGNQKDWSQTGIIFTGLAFTSWRHLDMYGLDFGDSFGSLHHFDLSFGLLDGAIIVLPKYPTSDQNEADWDVHITLHANDLEALVKDDLIQWLMSPRGQ